MFKNIIVAMVMACLSFSAFAASDELDVSVSTNANTFTLQLNNDVVDLKEEVDVTSVEVDFKNNLGNGFLLLGGYDSSYDGDYYAGDFMVGYGSFTNYLAIGGAGMNMTSKGYDYEMQGVKAVWHGQAPISSKWNLGFDLEGVVGKVDVNGNELDVGSIGFAPFVEYRITEWSNVVFKYSYTKMGSETTEVRTGFAEYETVSGDFEQINKTVSLALNVKF